MTQNQINALINRLCIGEAVHCSFRKGADSHEASEVWRLIHEMDDYGDAVKFIKWSFEVALKGYRLPNAKRKAPRRQG